MRPLILFLILLNLAFFYWASEYGSREVVLENPQNVPGYQPIKLLSELEKEAQVVTDPPSSKNSTLKSQVSNTVTSQKCFSLGPLETDTQSDEIYDALFSAGIQAKQRTVNQREPKSYWVYLPSYESREEAQKVVDFLKKSNVEEYYIWFEESHKNAVSLGLFKKLSTAREKMEEIKKLNLKPEMEVRFDEFTEYWVDFSHDNQGDQPKVIEKMLRSNDRLLIVEAKCF